jgi:hypothetical protein
VSAMEHVTTPTPALQRTLWRIIPAFQLAMVSFWTTTTLTTPLLIERGEAAAMIGLFTALPWLAVLAATPVLSRLVAHLGLRASFQRCATRLPDRNDCGAAGLRLGRGNGDALHPGKRHRAESRWRRPHALGSPRADSGAGPGRSVGPGCPSRPPALGGMP